MRRYELYYRVKYIKPPRDEFWLYYGRYGTYNGAVQALEVNRDWLNRDYIECKLGKVRDSHDGSVSFYDIRI